MNNVYTATKNEWAGYKDKVFETPYQIELLSQSLYGAQYGNNLSVEMKKFFEFLYDNVRRINLESFSKQALENVTIIRHKVQSNDCKLMILGCKKCNKMTDALYFASGHLDYQEEALNVLQGFFMPYCPEVQSSGGEILKRKQYWQQY